MTEREFNDLIKKEIIECLRFNEQSQLNPLKEEVLDFLLGDNVHFNELFLQIKDDAYHETRKQGLPTTPDQVRKFLIKSRVQSMTFAYYQNHKQETKKTI